MPARRQACCGGLAGDSARPRYRYARDRLLHHRCRQCPQGACHGGGKQLPFARCARFRRCRWRTGGDADLHGRRRGGGLCQGRADSSCRWAAKAVHCGEAGAGQAAKICNNMILGISMIGVAEAFRSRGKTRPVASGFVRCGLHLLGAMLVAHHLLPGSWPGADQPRPITITSRVSQRG